MKKRLKIALVLLIAPFILLPAVLTAYAIMSFWIASIGGDVGSTAVATARIVNGVLGLLGVIGVAGFVFGWPIGIYYAITMDREKK